MFDMVSGGLLVFYVIELLGAFTMPLWRYTEKSKGTATNDCQDTACHMW